MDRRNFFKTMLMTPLFTPLLLASQSRTSESELFLIADNPEDHIPLILQELNKMSLVNGNRFALLNDFPSESGLLDTLSGAGLRHVSGAADADITLSHSVLRHPASPSFALVRNGKVWDLRSRRLMTLWRDIYHGRQNATGLTVMALRKPSAFSTPGDSITIYRQGRAIARMKLDTDRSARFSVKTGEISVRIRGGKACIDDSSCRNHICQLSPPVCLGGERIICAPNHLLIQVNGTTGVDTVIG